MNPRILHAIITRRSPFWIVSTSLGGVDGITPEAYVESSRIRLENVKFNNQYSNADPARDDSNDSEPMPELQSPFARDVRGESLRSPSPKGVEVNLRTNIRAFRHI